ncbi:hypothetical protein FIBSPDRAFT_454191 [Athelia psychrophila]|uniref:Uncharacterized protein n=1 Tax=Athelia psychrophila TaxID=1759441 RepID=A0A167UCX3_9AGAM|nr:hypothetical protein FIBSPDRAFT_454191 [Fibularhizoctonia sp. CBS 109695]
MRKFEQIHAKAVQMSYTDLSEACLQLHSPISHNTYHTHPSPRRREMYQTSAPARQKSIEAGSIRRQSAAAARNSKSLLFCLTAHL